MVHNFLLWDMISPACAAAADRVAADLAVALRAARVSVHRRPDASRDDGQRRTTYASARNRRPAQACPVGS